jgi:chromosome segregation ATPase
MDSVNKLEMVLEPREGAVKIVEDGRLDWESEGGWVLIAIVQEADARTEFVQKHIDGYMQNEQEVVPYTRTRFVLRQDPKSTLADLKDKFARAAKEDWDFRRELEDARKVLEDGDKRIEEATKELREQSGRKDRTIHTLEERVARLEEDLETQTTERDTKITELRRQLRAERKANGGAHDEHA